MLDNYYSIVKNIQLTRAVGDVDHGSRAVGCSSLISILLIGIIVRMGQRRRNVTILVVFFTGGKLGVDDDRMRIVCGGRVHKKGTHC